MKVQLEKRNRIWHVRYYKDGRGVRRSLRVENRKIAEQLRRKFEWKLNCGEEPAEKKRVRIDEFLEEYKEFSLSRKRAKTHVTDMGRLQDYSRVFAEVKYAF